MSILNSVIEILSPKKGRRMNDGTIFFYNGLKWHYLGRLAVV